MKFADLVKIRDAAIAHNDECAATEEACSIALETAQGKHAESLAALADAHLSIHNILAQYGEHYLIADDGTLTVFKPVDNDIGYIAVHPIPGTMPPPSDA